VPSSLAPGKDFFYFFKNFFAGCRLTWHPAKVFFYFLKNFFAGCPLTWHPAKAFLPGANLAPGKLFIFYFVFLALFFCEALLQ
jgi:hypothetical protein